MLYYVWKGGVFMGCLLDFLFELVFEILAEAITSLYIKAMTLFFPNHQYNDKTQQRIRTGVTIFAVLLLLCATIGFIMYMQDDPLIKSIGSYLLFVPLIIMGIQIIAGIIYRIVEKFKKKK